MADWLGVPYSQAPHQPVEDWDRAIIALNAQGEAEEYHRERAKNRPFTD